MTKENFIYFEMTSNNLIIDFVQFYFLLSFFYFVVVVVIVVGKWTISMDQFNWRNASELLGTTSIWKSLTTKMNNWRRTHWNRLVFFLFHPKSRSLSDQMNLHFNGNFCEFSDIDNIIRFRKTICWDKTPYIFFFSCVCELRYSEPQNIPFLTNRIAERVREKEIYNENTLKMK